MKILVTGGAGFIGSNLVRKLLATGHIVFVLDDYSTGYESNLLGLDAELVQGSILNFELLSEIAAKADAIVHLAALGSVTRSRENPLLTHDVNVNGTINVLEVAKMFQTYTIFSSSSSVYGSVPTIPRNEDLPTRPMSPYAASKLAGEAYFAAYQEAFNIKSTVFRLFNVFGPRQSFNHPYAAVIPNFIQSCLRESPIRVEGSGMQTRDFTYIDTVTDTFLSAINRQLHIKTPVNLALGSSVSIIELIKLLRLISGKEVQIKHEPRRIGDVDNSESDPTMFHNKFPNIASLSFYDSLTQTYDYYKNKFEKYN